MTIPVLTIRQPWAGLIVAGKKVIENRSFKPPQHLIGQRMAIHAGQAKAPHAQDLAYVSEALMQLTPAQRKLVEARGEIIGTVVVDSVIEPYDRPHAREICAECELDWWLESRNGWVLRNPRKLRQPIEAKGRLGIWYTEEL